MASFATSVKNELVHVVDEDRCCKQAELAGLLRMGAAISFNKQHHIGINFTTENAAVARKVLSLLKDGVNAKVPTEITVSRSNRLRKHNTYSIRAVPSPEVSKVLDSIGFTSTLNLLDAHQDKLILSKPCCIAAYLRGAFLGGGTVNQPEISYHLEFVTSNRNFASLLLELCHSIYLPAGLTDRKGSYIVYLKDSEGIIELLGLIGLDEEYLEQFESARNLKEIRNQVNRLVNCETANLQRTVDAASRQIYILKKIKKQPAWKELKPALRKTAELRIKYPEASLAELGERLGCSKSAIHHRLAKLEGMLNENTEER